MILDRYIKITLSKDNTVYDSENDFGITAGSMKFDEALCNSEFSLRELCASKFEVQCFNLAEDVTGWNIQVAYKPLNGADNQYVDIFNGVIDSSSTDNFNDFRDIVAYDRLYTLRDEDVGVWWDTFWVNRPQQYTVVSTPVGTVNNSYYEQNGSEYELSEDTEVDSSKTYYYGVPTIATVGEIRLALCTSVGLACESATLINDGIQTKKYLSSSNSNAHTQIKFGDLMSMLCEINGVIGHINRSGVFAFTTFDTAPSTLGLFEKANAKFEDYETSLITGINVYESSENLMLAYGDSTNTYKIAGNIFTLTLDDYSILQTICSRILNKIQSIRYVPCTIPVVVSDLTLQLGNMIQTENGTRTHYIMSQSYSGSLLVNQTIECKAYGDVLRQDVSDINNNIIINQRYSTIMQDQNQIRFEVANTQTQIDELDTTVTEQISTITQTADDLEIRVARNEDARETYETRVNISVDGVKISKSTEGAYTMFTDTGMYIYVKNAGNEPTAWAEAEGFASKELMIGNNTTKWHLQEANDGNTLVFIRR